MGTRQEFFANPKDFKIDGTPNFASIAGNQNNYAGNQNRFAGNQNNVGHYGTGNQYSNFGRGTQNLNHGRDQNVNSGSGGFTVNNNEPQLGRNISAPVPHGPQWTSQPPDPREEVRPAPPAAPPIVQSPPQSRNDNFPFTSRFDQEYSSPRLRSEEDAFMKLLEDKKEYRYVIKDQPPDFRQTTLDEWQALYNQTNREDVKANVLSSIIELANNSGCVPLCSTLRGLEDLSKGPVSYGVLTSLWRGRLRGRQVAVKVMNYRIPHVQEHVDYLLRRSILGRQLVHPNVNPFHGIHYFTEDREQLCLVSPWMERGNILQYLQTATDPNRLALVRGVAEGLAYLHHMRVVHGALKGYNILIADDLTPRITDIGLFDGLASASGSFSSALRNQGSVRWLAPEQVRGGRRTEATLMSDVYAFAHVCFEVYAGHIPYYEYEDFAVYPIIVEYTLPSRPSQVPDMLWELMNRCWVVHPPSRPTALQITNGLKEIRPALPTPRSSTPKGRSSYLTRARG